MKVSRRTLITLFVGYNLVLAGLIIGPLTAQLFPTLRTLTFSNSDFTQTTIGTTPVEMSNPFRANSGEALTLNMQVIAVNNASGRPFVVVFSPSKDYGPCTGCGVTIAQLGNNGDLLSPPTPPTPETVSSYTYNITMSSTYVVLFYYRTFLVTESCLGCVAKIWGTIAIAPSNPPPLAYFPLPLVVLGFLVILIPGLRVLWNRFVIKREVSTEKRVRHG